MGLSTEKTNHNQNAKTFKKWFLCFNKKLREFFLTSQIYGFLAKKIYLFSNIQLLSRANLILLVLLLISLIIRFIFIEALLVSDDTDYFFLAEKYSPEIFTGGTNQTYFRLGLLLPVAIMQKLFGLNLLSYYAWTITIFLLLVFSSYSLSKIIDGEKMAIISVLMAITSYFFLYQSSNLLPDIPCLISAVFSFIFFFFSLNYKKYSKIFLLLSVLLGFISYTIRIPNIVFLLCIPIYEFLSQKSIKKSIYYGLIFILFFLIETSIYFVLTGELFTQIKSNSSNMAHWSIYMNNISIREYLFAPFNSYFASNTGKILILGGMCGFFLALKRKNWTIVSLTISGFIIFLIYNYSVTSITPLVRALPLSERYIISFSFVCNLCTAYFLKNIPFLICRLNQNTNKFSTQIISKLILITVITFQLVELPSLLSNNAIFWGNNSYFLFDQYINNSKQYYQAKTILAYPDEIFNLYPNINDLNLKPMDFSKPLEPGQLMLLSIDRLNKNLYYAKLRNDTDYITMIEPYTLGYNYDLSYIFDSGDIIFARFEDTEIKLTEITDIADISIVGNIWASSADNVKPKQNNDSIISFELSPSTKPFYIYSSPGNWETAPIDTDDIYTNINSEDLIYINLIYSLKEDLNSNLLFIQQYDEVERIYSESYSIEWKAGTHEIRKYINLLPNTTKLRFYFRMENYSNFINEISLNQLQINKIEK
ncbi:MAG: glycosyltransferase family 39 protein [Anaerolineaceae bacterium]|nr:glycosyltransferase family 39 protein [Anaerolineaceae bacterium]